MKPRHKRAKKTQGGQKQKWCSVSIPSVLQPDTRHHYPVGNDGTAAAVVMGDPVSAAESCQSVYDRCKMLHECTQTAGGTFKIFQNPTKKKVLTSCL